MIFDIETWLWKPYFGTFWQDRKSYAKATEDAYISMITVVGFRAKQATGSQYMLTDKLYPNYFFIRIDLDWLEHDNGTNFWFSKSFFYFKNQPNLSKKFFIEELKIRRRTFIIANF
jgi:hypothetical protein